MKRELLERLTEIEKHIDAYLPEHIENAKDVLPQCSLPFGVIPADALTLSAPVRELVKRGGKRWRPLLCVLAYELAGGKADDAYPLTPLIELCHTASLVHDDIEDNSKTRRGGLAVHIKHGTGTAINSGAWLYFHAGACVFNTTFSDKTKNRILHLYFKNLSRLHLGQSMDISWHADLDFIPTQEQYEAMIRLKTGSLAKLAGELGFAAAGESVVKAKEFGNIAESLGAGFQILDDVKNITGNIAGKDAGDDIVEGKKSLPVILYLKENCQQKKIIQSLFKQAREEGVLSPAVKKCTGLLTASQAVQQAEAYGKALIEKALTQFAKIYGTGSSPDRRSLNDLSSRNDSFSAADLIQELFNMLV